MVESGIGPAWRKSGDISKAARASWVMSYERVWYRKPVLGLHFGEIFLVAFIFLAVVLAPYGGRAGAKLARLLKSDR